MANGKEPKSLEKGLLETVANSDIQDVAKDGAEIVIDSLLDAGVLRDIPIVNTVLGLAKAGVSVKDRLFAEKVLRFLNPLSKYSSEERRQYLNDLDQDELKKASQYMVLYIDRLDSLDKPAMLGKVFEAYMLGRIGFKAMLYFSHFIDSIFILTWQDYYQAIKHWHDNRAGTPQIAIDDALALEKVGFYVEHTKPDEYFEPQLRVGMLKGIKRKLVLTDAGWQFI